MTYCCSCHAKLTHTDDCPERYGLDDDDPTDLEDREMTIRDCTTHFHVESPLVAEVERSAVAETYALRIKLEGDFHAPLVIHCRTLSTLFNLGAAIQDGVAKLGGGTLAANVQAEHMLDGAHAAADHEPIDYAELGTAD